jgi:hypothetical protein
VRSVGGAASTIVRAPGAKRVFYITDPGAILDGFTIRDGYCTIGDVYNSSYGYIAAGAGVWMLNGTVRNCTVYSNSAVYGHMAAGGGVYMDGGRLYNCTVLANSISSGNGREEGGGVHALGSASIERCIIAYNRTLNNGFASTDGGGGLWMGGSVTARTCLVAANQIALANANHRGAGVRMQGGLLENSTVVQNRSAATEGGVYVGAGSVVNCIIADNAAASAPTNIAPIAAVTYSCAPELTSGSGNIASNPVFQVTGSGAGTSAVLGVYKLGASPCVNAGTNAAWMAAAVDVLGLPRVARSRVDMGAYEQQPPAGSVFVVR